MKYYHCKPVMTESEAKLHKKLVRDQLTIISLYWSDFERRLGKKGLNDLINSVLDRKLQLDREYPDIRP